MSTQPGRITIVIPRWALLGTPFLSLAITLGIILALDPGTPAAVEAVQVAASGGSGPTAPATVRYQEALTLVHEGKFEQAIPALRAAIQAPGMSASRRHDLEVALGEAHLGLGQYQDAVAAVQPAIAQVVNQTARSKARLVQADAWEATGRTADAAAALTFLAEEEPAIAATVNAALVSLYTRTGNLAAAEARAALVLADPSASETDRAAAREGRIATAGSSGEHQIAARELASLEGQVPDWRTPEILYRRAESLRRAGQAADADIVLQQIITSYPASGWARQSLDYLLANRPDLVTGRTQALVRYFQGPAATALPLLRNQVRATAFDEATNELRLYLARTYLALGQRTNAVTELNLLRQNAAPSAVLGSANYELAVLREADGAVEEAFTLYQQAARYPGRFAGEAGYRAGRIRWNQGNIQGARQAWLDAATVNTVTAEQSRLLYWAARAAWRAGDPVTANQLMGRVAAQPSYDYYVARARSANPFDPAPFSRPTTAIKPALDPAAELAEADAWMKARFSVPEGTVPHVMGPAMATDPSVQRYLRLAELGLENEASQELVAVTTRYGADPVALYQLAIHTGRMGNPRLSIQAHRAFLAASGLNDPLDLPMRLLRGLYPLDWLGPLLAESDAAGIDPLLLASIIRLESLFQTDARSSANAFGLTQVIPATGAEIARALGIQDYDHADLQRPYLSIRFGATYLRRMLDYQRGNTPLALASYNGGAGNVDRWSGGNRQMDIDEFIERITFPETRTYVSIVYQNYRAYSAIYGP